MLLGGVARFAVRWWKTTVKLQQPANLSFSLYHDHHNDIFIQCERGITSCTLFSNTLQVVSDWESINFHQTTLITIRFHQPITLWNNTLPSDHPDHYQISPTHHNVKQYTTHQTPHRVHKLTTLWNITILPCALYAGEAPYSTVSTVWISAVRASFLQTCIRKCPRYLSGIIEVHLTPRNTCDTFSCMVYSPNIIHTKGWPNTSVIWKRGIMDISRKSLR